MSCRRGIPINLFVIDGLSCKFSNFNNYRYLYCINDLLLVCMCMNNSAIYVINIYEYKYTCC